MRQSRVQTWIYLVEQHHTLIVLVVFYFGAAAPQTCELVVVHKRNEVAAPGDPVRLSDSFSECLEIVVLSYHDASVVVHVPFFHVIGDVEECYLFLWRRNWQHYCHHWVESDRYSVALVATHGALELPMEEVSDDGFISEQVLVPGFLSSLLFRLVFDFVCFNIRLLALSV